MREEPPALSMFWVFFASTLVGTFLWRQAVDAGWMPEWLGLILAAATGGAVNLVAYRWAKRRRSRDEPEPGAPSD